MIVDRIQFVVYDSATGIILRGGTASSLDAWAQASSDPTWQVACCPLDSLNVNEVTDGLTTIDSLADVEWLTP